MRRSARALKWSALILGLWAGAWLFAGDGWFLVRAGVYLAPFLTLAAASLALAAIAMRVHGAAIIFGAVALYLLFAQPWLWRVTETRDGIGPTGDAIKLTTLSNRTANRDMKATAEMLNRHRADILVLQEIADPTALIAALEAGAEIGGEGMLGACHEGPYVILSRFAVGTPRRLDGNAALVCEVALPRGPVRVYSIHLPRAIGAETPQRNALETVLADAARSPVPVILAGDFNATPLSGTMRRAARGRINAFDHAGAGFGATFPTSARRMGALGPFLRIDHVLLPPSLPPVSARRMAWHPPGADHFPLTVRFRDTRPLDPAGTRVARAAPP